MSAETQPPLVSLDDQRAAEHCLLAYARGIDRLDADLIASGFHPEATLEGYGRPGTTTIEAFIERAIPSLANGWEVTQHRISNIWLEDRGDHIAGEAYVLATHVRGNELATFCGRYIDRFERRDGRLRLSARRLRLDWSNIDTIAQPMAGDYVAGSRDGTDASYR